MYFYKVKLAAFFFVFKYFEVFACSVCAPTSTLSGNIPKMKVEVYFRYIKSSERVTHFL